jgi:sec-independent protein translocase protein TatA
MGLSLGHLLILLLVVLLFGARRLPQLGSGLGKGLRAFKKGLEGQDPDEDDDAPKAKITKAKSKSDSDDQA